MKKMMIDMDDVLCAGGHLGILNQFLNTNYTLEDLPGYFVEDLVPEERLTEYYEFFQTQNVYDYVTVMEDAVEVLEKLSKQYQLFICTAYYTNIYEQNYSRLLLDKYDWLQRQFPFISPYQYVFINDKSLLECDVKIDDRLDNLHGYGEIKFLFTSHHNQNISDQELTSQGIVRVSSWKEIEQLLLEE